ncbi:MAG: hypothetical protein KAV42_09760 [Candidatus Krumholzibacteria bacterium]|nr:hypothetical protein [Candidatus Krumholzibacteria bacterium]
MKDTPDHRNEYSITRFDRQFFTGKERFTFIGSGELGGKAHGLAKMSGILGVKPGNAFEPDISVSIPRLSVVTTEYFDLFMKENDLFEVALSGKRDDLIAHAFQKGSLPVGLSGDLRAIVEQVHTPLAIRSSSMLEDAMFEPFASVYATKMVPNNQPGADSRFKKLAEAVKFVYASTYFKSARDYMRVASHTIEDEKMAVIIQEIVGNRFGERFYPHVSGVMRSFNFYPFGRATPKDGIVELALGLGRTIVDDGISWPFSPAYPATPPPFKSTGDMLKHSQTGFWAVNMGRLHRYDPVEENEYLEQYSLNDAEYDGTINLIASTYNGQDDRMESGTFFRGPRLINFAPVLQDRGLPLNDLLKIVRESCEDKLGTMVEIEFAMRLGKEFGEPAEFGFLQVRPMVVAQSDIEIKDEELGDENALLASRTVLGNGSIDSITDIVYVDPDRFDVKDSLKIAEEVDSINSRLVDEGRKYILIGFGRWGTTDPLGGIPVDFGQISGARVIVESSLPDLNFLLSQGSHFFHNVTSFKVFYFSIQHDGEFRIDWDWLKSMNVFSETEHVRHLRLDSPLTVKVDGKRGRGMILHG